MDILTNSEDKESEEAANKNQHEDAGEGTSRQTSGVPRMKGTRHTRWAQDISRELDRRSRLSHFETTCTESDVFLHEHIHMWVNFQPWTLSRGNRETDWPMLILNASLWLQQQTTNTTWRKSRTCMPASAHPSIKVNMVLIENVLAVLFLFCVQFICRNAHLQRWLGMLS